MDKEVHNFWKEANQKTKNNQKKKNKKNQQNKTQGYNLQLQTPC